MNTLDRIINSVADDPLLMFACGAIGIGAILQAAVWGIVTRARARAIRALYNEQRLRCENRFLRDQVAALSSANAVMARQLQQVGGAVVAMQPRRQRDEFPEVDLGDYE